MNYIVQIPSEGIIVKLQIWLSEIEEREGNERWLLSLTPPRKAVENILIYALLVTGRILCRPFGHLFPVFVEAHNPGIFKGPEVKGSFDFQTSSFC